MFHSAAVKLTLWYLALITALSIGTSFALYHVSSNYLEENAKRQASYFSGLLGPQNAREFSNLRFRQLADDRNKLKSNLVIFNLLVLGGGGAASYGLARRTLKPIEDALESQVRFAADASHELRTPLTAIQTENEVALRNAKLSRVEAIKLLRSNLEEVGKLKTLSEGLLSLAHSRQDHKTTVLSARTLVKKAKDRAAKAASLKKINLRTSSVNGDVNVRGNEQKIVDLLVILLDNAIKYSPAGSSIKIDIKKNGKSTEIIVSDKGQGIKRSDLPSIFERFYRADHSRNKQKTTGYGLGLAIAKKIADQHGAAIQVRSAAGKGSTFTVRFPKA